MNWNLIAAIIISLALTVAAQAARITDAGLASYMSEEEREKCAIIVSGEIEAGDAAAFRTLATELGFFESEFKNTDTSFEKAVCFDSWGGDPAEAIAMAETMHDGQIGSRILDGMECANECGIVFFAGLGQGYESGSYNDRTLEIGARLSVRFRAFEYASGAADKRTALLVHRDLVSRLLKLGTYVPSNDIIPRLAPAILVELISEDGHAIEISTIEDAELADVELKGATSLLLASDTEVTQTCYNFLSWRLGETSVDIARIGTRAVDHTIGTRFGSETPMAHVNVGGMYNRECQIEVSAEPNGQLMICGQDEATGAVYGNCAGGYPEYIPSYYMLSPDTAINALGN